ncbi:MAG: hypothetical protein EOP06_01830 [Proteobacteria bacterium]|nr:MAG: hypothetical protein EOP06_01830 [Pseudomonadota bacterium]
MRNLSFLIFISALNFLIGCKSNEAVPQGQYVGSIDGNAAKTITATFNATADGFLTSGRWESNTIFGNARIAVEHSDGKWLYQLMSVKAPCFGRFPVQLKVEQSEIKGSFAGSTECPDSKFSFTLKPAF